MPMTDADRLKQLKLQPHCFNQGDHGSCGFAGALMGLLVHAPAEVDALYKTISAGAVYRNVPKSAKVKSRLQKRMDNNLLEKNEDHALDVRLAIGLMISFKEYLKHTNQAALWDESKAYSSLFKDQNQRPWDYGNHLKDFDAKVNPIAPEDEFAFTYKNGDMALPPAAQASLLKFVGFKSVSTSSLISNEELVKHNYNLQTVTVNQQLKARLLRLASDIKVGTYAGAMIGVAHKDFIGVQANAKYEYVAHWIYMPKPNGGGLANVFANTTWTWGDKWTLQKLLDDGDYVPKVAVTFEGP